MSFVGTRPEVVKYVKKYKPEYFATLLLPAGITSEASIKYKDEAELLDAAEDVDEVYITKVLPEKKDKKKQVWNKSYIRKELLKECHGKCVYCESLIEERLNEVFMDSLVGVADCRLDEVGLCKGQKFALHYDFGDDWMFTITVSKISEVQEDFEPRVIKSKGTIQQSPDWDEEDFDEE